MKSFKHKVKDGKPHKKARVARFITGNFYFMCPNKVMNYPFANNPQLIPQPINNISNISNQQYNNNIKGETYVHQTNHNIYTVPCSNSSIPANNQEQSTNNTNDHVLEVETLNKPFPDCVNNVIPKNFDIVKRGQLPSISFHNNKISIIES